MIPGPIYVYECPNCGNPIKMDSLTSGNTFGEKIFSDGKSIDFMLPDEPDLTKCKQCDTMFWLSKLKEIGSYRWDIPSADYLKWQSADNAAFLEIEDYFKALEIGLAENEIDELFIRQQIWWTYNDRIRDKQAIFNDEDDEIRWEQNVKNLIKLLDETNVNHIIMLAEMNRNLGNFEACIKIIESIDKVDFNWLKEKFLIEAEKKNKWVVKLN